LQFLNTSCLPALLEIVESADPDEAARALYALSALVRDNTHGLRAFYQHGGPALLETILADESAETRLQKKGVGLLGDLSLLQGGRQAPGYASLATSKVMRALLRLMSTGDVDMREKVVHAVHALLAKNPRALKVFKEKAMELEKLRKIEERLEDLSKVGVDKKSGGNDKDWQKYMDEIVEISKQVEETVKGENPGMLGDAKGNRTKDEL
jgi:hsp70-interacting protein